MPATFASPVHILTGMRVVVRYVVLALTLSFPAIEARAQSPAADELFVVVLATTASRDQRPAAKVPEDFRDKLLYWRQLKADSYQLALGFFGYTYAEAAQRRLVASFPEARVFLISAAERENALKAQQRVAPATLAPPAQAISLAPPPAAAPEPAAQAVSPPASSPTSAPSAQAATPAARRGFRPDLRVKLGGAAGIDKIEVLNIVTASATQEGGGNLQVELVMATRSESGVGFVGSVGLFARQHNGKVQDPVLPTDIEYNAEGVSGSVGISVKANESLHFEGRLELGVGSGEPKLTTPGVVWNSVKSGTYTSTAFIFGGYYTFTRPGVQIGLELGSQSFDGDFQIWNNAGYWSDGKVSGSGVIGNVTVGFRF